MKKSIRETIDAKIVKLLMEKGYHETRQELLDTSRRFSQRIPDNIELVKEELNKLKDVKVRYTGLYIIWSNKRIIDLYKLETNDIRGITNPVKKFRALLFKERLENKYNLPNN